MGRTKAQIKAVEIEAIENDETETEEADAIETEIEEADEPEVHSVVDGKYKARYRERAANMARKPKDVSQKAMARSTCDWLAVELARRVLTQDKKAKLIVEKLEAILDANGINHAKWNRTTPGWQGRLRMTGSIALRRVVAENNELALPGEEPLTPPKAWVAKHSN